MDGKRIETFSADAAPLPVTAHKPLIDAETGLFTDRTGDCAKAPFDFLLREYHH